MKLSDPKKDTVYVAPKKLSVTQSQNSHGDQFAITEKSQVKPEQFEGIPVEIGQLPNDVVKLSFAVQERERVLSILNEGGYQTLEKVSIIVRGRVGGALMVGQYNVVLGGGGSGVTSINCLSPDKAGLIKELAVNNHPLAALSSINSITSSDRITVQTKGRVPNRIAGGSLCFGEDDEY